MHFSETMFVSFRDQEFELVLRGNDDEDWEVTVEEVDINGEHDELVIRHAPSRAGAFAEAVKGLVEFIGEE